MLFEVLLLYVEVFSVIPRIEPRYPCFCFSAVTRFLLVCLIFSPVSCSVIYVYVSVLAVVEILLPVNVSV